jgi:periplasmic protein TonB
MQAQNLSSSILRVPARLLVVVGLHIVLIWALLNGIGVRAPSAGQPPDIEGSMLPAKPVPPVEKFVPPDPTQPVIHEELNLIPPEISQPPELETNAPEVIGSNRPVTDGPGTARTQPVITAAAVDAHTPLTQPPYPLASIRSGEEGALALDILVGVDGHVRDAKVSRSSGSARLDQAALNEAKHRWRLRPATRDGTPFEQWLTLRVVFRLENR